MNGQNCSRAGAASIEDRKSKIENEKGYSARRWRGNTSLSAHENRLQTAPPDIRQTDDLLSPGDFDARRPTRGAHHHDTEGFANAPQLFGRRRATGHSHRVRRATETGRNRPGFFDRREIYRQLRRIAHSWRQYLLREARLLSRRTCHRARSMHFRLSSSRPGALWRGRVRRRRQSDQSRRKADAAEKPFRRARALRLRRARFRSLPDAASISSRRARDHRSEFALSRAQRAKREAAQPRHGLARYRHHHDFA